MGTLHVKSFLILFNTVREVYSVQFLAQTDHIWLRIRDLKFKIFVCQQSRIWRYLLKRYFIIFMSAVVNTPENKQSSTPLIIHRCLFLNSGIWICRQTHTYAHIWTYIQISNTSAPINNPWILNFHFIFIFLFFLNTYCNPHYYLHGINPYYHNMEIWEILKYELCCSSLLYKFYVRCYEYLWIFSLYFWPFVSIIQAMATPHVISFVVI